MSQSTDSLDFYRSLVEHIPGILYSAVLNNGNYSLQYVSPQIASVLGTPLSIWLEHPGQFFMHVYQEDWDALIENLEHAASTGEPFELDYRMKRADGETIWIRDRGTCFHRQGVSGSQFLGLWVDITHHKHIEDELGHWDRELRQLTDHIPDILCRISRQGHLLYLNRWFHSSDPVPPETYLGKTFAEMGMPEDLSKKFERALKTSSETREATVVEFSLPHLEAFLYFEARVIPECDPVKGVDTILCVIRDVTEHKQIQEERIKRSKLDSLGVFAGGLAHDFNNSLTAILGQLSLAKMSLSPEAPLYHRLKEAETASMRARGLTQQLLTFAKGGAPVKETINLQSLIKENTQFGLTGSNIHCHFYLAEDLWAVEADVGQVSQVIQNLVINARQAMPQGGHLTIQAYNVSISSDGDPKFSWLQPGSWVLVSIEDKGVGIPEDIQKKIFDPYFTTKSTGNGLGLASSYSIMNNHGGHIKVSSIVNSGTTFTLCFPASPKAAAPHAPSEIGLQTGKGKVLVLDDDEHIRSMVGEMLEVCGYTSVMVKSGQEAIQAFTQAKEAGAPFQAVILDLIIRGGSGGKEVIQQLRNIDPDINGIVVSGYSNDPVLANFQEYGFKGRLSKPFRLQELSQELQTVLPASHE